MASIKTLLLDLGGVLLNLDYQATEQAFAKLGFRSFTDYYHQNAQQPFFDRLEAGKETPEAFRSKIRELSGLALSNDEIDSAWNAMLFDLPESRIELLLKLKPHYQLILFSNTNAIHYEALQLILHQQYQQDILQQVFDRVFYSHLLGLRKPQPEAFKKVLASANANPETTLFIDDTQRHIEGARHCKIQARLLQNHEDVEEILTPFLKP
ncbi:HAD-IA family hydrolase [Parashewanella tropica]|uniref:HAD-IA family hydrolase n=1 Tax=Parashewanella tropica TaxID=2547970 RepID=UPI00105A5288|nr:HAD-IA family hydrolase [Parashewanella tropica]